MTTYYKGQLFLKENCHKLSANINWHWSNFDFFDDNIIIKTILNLNDYNIILNFLEEQTKKLYPFEIKNKKILAIIAEFYRFKTNPSVNIIFEKIKSSNGRDFAREIHTGLIFPIYLITEDSTINYKCCDKYVGKMSYNFLQHPNYDLLQCYCDISEIADNNEVKEYLEQFKTGFRKRSKEEKFRTQIQSLYNKNVLSKEIEFEEEITPTFKSKNRENEVMENIEYLLSVLRDSNPELYNKYNTEYQKLLNSNESLTLSPISLSSLITLESSIELSMNLNKRNASNIIEYLDNLISKYLSNFLTGNDKTTDITLQELDNINETFLKSQVNYNIQTQRLILRKLSFAFLLEVKENIDSITEEYLANSYFSQNIKSIFTVIKSLMFENVISVNIPIDFVNDLTISNILNIIRNIQFNKFDNEKANELIKNLKN